jgi:hypothetical protein
MATTKTAEQHVEKLVRLRLRNEGIDACIAVIQAKIDFNTNKIMSTYVDSPSGRTETIEEGEWMGSAYEWQLFNELKKKFEMLKR